LIILVGLSDVTKGPFGSDASANCACQQRWTSKYLRYRLSYLLFVISLRIKPIARLLNPTSETLARIIRVGNLGTRPVSRYVLMSGIEVKRQLVSIRANSGR